MRILGSAFWTEVGYGLGVAVKGIDIFISCIVKDRELLNQNELFDMI